MPEPRVILQDPADDVAIAATDIPAGATVPLPAGPPAAAPRAVTARDAVARGHKIALRDLPAGHAVLRYGQIIGFALSAITTGDHVHVHNLAFGEFDRGPGGRAGAAPEPVSPDAGRVTFRGYPRSDGTAGTRNYLGVLTSVNCSATAAQQIAARLRQAGMLDDYEHVDGVVALTHGQGCGMAGDGEGMTVLRRVMRGYLTHPNFGGFLVLGLGCEDNQVAELTRGVPVRSDIPIVAATIQELGGTRKTVAEGVRLLEEMLPEVNKARRRDMPANRIVLGTECGGSDSYSGMTANPALGNAADRLIRLGGTAILGETPEIYGAEHLLAGRAVSEEVARKLLARIDWWREYTAKNGGTMDNNPSPGNKAGGLTTILEKSLGAVAKGGTTALADVVEYAEPVTGPGLVFMDTPGYDPVSVTGLVAGGANVVCFTTGRGSAFGCAPVPSIKIATNTPLHEHMAEDMDINAGEIADGTAAIAGVGEEILARILAVASGEPTKSEQLGYGEPEFVPWHIGTVM
jgi:altronate hydrolase